MLPLSRVAVVIILCVATIAGAQGKPRTPINVSYDAEHLDLQKRVLQFKISRPADTADLVVLDESGKEIGKASIGLKDQKPNTWIPITWTQPDNTTVMMLKLRVASEDGVASNVKLIPWSVTVDHEDVTFATDSAKIETSEESKLDASLEKINDIVKRSEQFIEMQLYIAGHTDTVGPNAKNRKLSLDRARAIAAYFRKKGLKLPVAFAGFGEEVLKARTPDNTDERANRRVDYVLGPKGGAPPFKGPYLKVKAGWQAIK
ncbi:MAG: OmpA family protein [Deltaproteobacteria bacterium]|nr:OmpA family protein [Deltaproteobacteria bacterium]